MRRIPELDALRGLAAVAIVLYHLEWRGFNSGWAAVDLFFVLSGYLVSTIILRHGREPGFVRNFYARRGLRIWPIYYLTLFALIALNIATGSRLSMAGLGEYLTYTQNIERLWSGETPNFLNGFYQHTWTLAIEEQFYILWPIALLLFGHRGLRPLICGMLIVPLVMRAFGFHWWLLTSRCDGFAFGAILAALMLDPELAKPRMKSLRLWFATAAVVPVGILLAASTDATVGYQYYWQDSFWLRGPALTLLNASFFGICGLVLSFTGHAALRPLRNPVLVYLGSISYGIYLYHAIYIRFASMPQFESLTRRLTPGGFVIVLTLLTSAISWKFVEKPILSLKDRFHYGMTLPKELEIQEVSEVDPGNPMVDFAASQILLKED